MKHQNPFKTFEEFILPEGFEVVQGSIKPDLSCIISTCVNNIPSSRTVFIKKLINEEFYFFTNKNSKKGQEALENPNISMCFLFEKSFKQIIIQGKAQLAPHSYAEEYFQTRPVLSKAGAILSRQSENLADYEGFLEEVQKLSESKTELKCPEEWVAFRVVPEEFEFWEGSTFRLHLRTKYKKDLNSKNLWFQYNLYP